MFFAGGGVHRRADDVVDIDMISSTGFFEERVDHQPSEMTNELRKEIYIVQTKEKISEALRAEGATEKEIKDVMKNPHMESLLNKVGDFETKKTVWRYLARYFFTKPVKKCNWPNNAKQSFKASPHIKRRSWL